MEASEPDGPKRPETGEISATADVTVALTPAAMPELAWTATQMRAEGRIIINSDLIAAYQAASSPHSIRALKSDLEAFDLWCRRMKRVACRPRPKSSLTISTRGRGRGQSPHRSAATRRR